MRQWYSFALISTLIFVGQVSFVSEFFHCTCVTRSWSRNLLNRIVLIGKIIYRKGLRFSYAIFQYFVVITRCREKIWPFRATC